MPKGKPKKRNEKSNLRNPSLVSEMEYLHGGSSEDGSMTMNDNASDTSSMSGSIVYEDDPEPAEEMEKFKEDLDKAIGSMMCIKSVRDRILNIEFITDALRRKYVPELVMHSLFTLNDAIEKTLRRGGGDEQAAAAQLAVLLVIQLGSSDFVDEICQSLIPPLLFIVGDTGRADRIRAQCCWALGLLAFIGDYDNVDEVMDKLRLFSFRSALNKNGCGEELHASAISAWCLLLTVASSTNSFVMYLEQMIELLDSNSVGIRIAAGEVIAVMWEQMKELGNTDECEPNGELLDKLEELATDSHKFRSKKDRKTQKSIFRHIMSYVKGGEFCRKNVHFGLENLTLDTWCRKKQYDAFRQALGSGMNSHLQENHLLRDIWNLGKKAPLLSPIHKKSKTEKRMMNAAAFKARSISRAKSRDKKNISIS